MFKSSGTSLIEVLISLIILSFLLLGLDAMQFVALKEAKSAYYFAVATQQLKVITERLQTVKLHHYHEQVVLWNQQNQTVLPQGRGVVTGEYPNYTLTIFWGSYLSNECSKNTIDQSGCLHISIAL